MKALFVSANRTFDPYTDSLDDLRNVAVHAWRITPKKAAGCDVVVVVWKKYPVGAFRLAGVIPNKTMPWDTTGRVKSPRTSLILRESLPLRPEWYENVPTLRNGVATVEF